MDETTEGAMTVAQVWRYPVKSMVGEQVNTADLVTTGMVGDRAWATRDEVRGGIRGAKKIAELMQLRARYVDDVGGPVEITFPDGSAVRTTDPDLSARVSQALGHEVTLCPLRPADDLDHYRRGAPDSDDVMEELRDIFGRELDEPLPDFSVFPPEVIEFESPPGTYLDAYPLLVMTTSALAALALAVPEANPDVRRFRPNIVIDTGDEPGHPEFSWVGRSLHIGDVELSIVAPCPRCVMVTRRIDDTIASDRSVLRHVVRDLDQNVGVYAAVTIPGRVSTGAPVALTSSQSDHA